MGEFKIQVPMGPKKLPASVPRLTPKMKKVYERAYEIMSKPGGWVQGSFLVDNLSNSHPVGWANHDIEMKAVCAVGGLQRAAWETLGKPDMRLAVYTYAVHFVTSQTQASEKGEAAVAVYELAEDARLRANYFAKLYAEVLGTKVCHTIVDINDGLASDASSSYAVRKARAQVLAIISRAGNLGHE